MVKNNLITIIKMKTKNLYQMLDKCTYILSNNIESQLEINEPLIDALQDVNYEEIMNTKLKDLDEYFAIEENEEELKGYGQDLLVKDIFDDMSEELRDEIVEKAYGMDYCEVYQTYHIDGYTAEILEDYGQLVRYNEDLNAHFWGVTHYGTAWSYVMDSVYPVQNEERYTFND